MDAERQGKEGKRDIKRGRLTELSDQNRETRAEFFRVSYPTLIEEEEEGRLTIIVIGKKEGHGVEFGDGVPVHFL